MRKETLSTVVPVLKTALNDGIFMDTAADDLRFALEGIYARWSGMGMLAREISESFVAGQNSAHKKRFYNAMNANAGIDIGSMISEEGLEDILNTQVARNVGLIKSIPDDYFKRIEQMVYDGVLKKSDSKSLISKITEIGYSTEARAKFIARDQTAKLNAALNRNRAERVSVEYIWRTGKDQRVRDNHRSKDGKIFRWDTPPTDTGHPGEDFQCRCYAEAIIDILK